MLYFRTVEGEISVRIAGFLLCDEFKWNILLLLLGHVSLRGVATVQSNHSRAVCYKGLNRQSSRFTIVV